MNFNQRMLLWDGALMLWIIVAYYFLYSVLDSGFVFVIIMFALWAFDKYHTAVVMRPIDERVGYLKGQLACMRKVDVLIKQERMRRKKK